MRKRLEKCRMLFYGWTVGPNQTRFSTASCGCTSTFFTLIWCLISSVCPGFSKWQRLNRFRIVVWSVQEDIRLLLWWEETRNNKEKITHKPHRYVRLHTNGFIAFIMIMILFVFLLCISLFPSFSTIPVRTWHTSKRCWSLDQQSTCHWSCGSCGSMWWRWRCTGTSSRIYSIGQCFNSTCHLQILWFTI